MLSDKIHIFRNQITGITVEDALPGQRYAISDDIVHVPVDHFVDTVLRVHCPGVDLLAGIMHTGDQLSLIHI